ncbi:hypothetical protein EDB84DRAFT_312441 [Lactarius hengduanensis]|nr:hypothetical protein EDB84DRAFT_312441 [Lactarius hengduanensis]
MCSSLRARCPHSPIPCTHSHTTPTEDVPPPAPPHRAPLHASSRALGSQRSPRSRCDWSGHGSTALRVSASFTDVPLEVLPGREREFRSFSEKVIWAAGAVAGVQGVVGRRPG